MNNKRIKIYYKNLFLLIFFSFSLIVCAGPFLWMVSTSFKTPANQFSKALIPSPITLENYKRLFVSTPYLLRQVFNSFQIAALTTIGQILTCGMAGFAFELFKFRGKKFFFCVVACNLYYSSAGNTDSQFYYFFQTAYGRKQTSSVDNSLYGRGIRNILYTPIFHEYSC